MVKKFLSKGMRGEPVTGSRTNATRLPRSSNGSTRDDGGGQGRTGARWSAAADAAFAAPIELRAGLDLILARCRPRKKLRARTDDGPGVRVLLLGSSGAGRTLAARWIAARLHLPLHRVNLPSVVSTYIGETEKNLARIFDQAARTESVLLFDEADALFGKRTGVSDSHDRYANLEVNYLLQRIENHAGIVLLSCNNKKRLGRAFTRRLDCIIELPKRD